jgi:hypothetical protein
VSGCGSSEDPTVNLVPKELIMKNVEMAIEGTMLTIRVDLSKEFGPSASGKTTIIASTEGNVTIPGREEKVGLNVYRKK